MSWVFWVLVVLVIVCIFVGVCFWRRRVLVNQEKKLVEFLKGHNGEVNPKWVKGEMGVSRAWLERVASRLEEKGEVVRWGWRAKSLIALKGSYNETEGRVVDLLKKNGGVMRQSAAWKKLGVDEESFYWRTLRKMEAKKILYRRTKGKRNFVVLVESKMEDGRWKMGGKVLGVKKKVLNKREEEMVLILEKAGSEMLDRNLGLRMMDSKKVIESLIKKKIVFRWGAKKRNICLVEMLNEHEEILVRILGEAGGSLMWRDFVLKSGYCGKGFCRVLDKLEMKGRIMRRKVGRSLRVELVGKGVVGK